MTTVNNIVKVDSYFSHIYLYKKWNKKLHKPAKLPLQNTGVICIYLLELQYVNEALFKPIQTSKHPILM